ncbi:OmpA family protein [Calditrichota bacterium LG25]
MKFGTFSKLLNENKQNLGHNLLIEKLDEISYKLKIAEALYFIYHGDYGSADSLFNEILKDHGENPILLDLQARSFAQQGRLTEAESLWKKALLLEPQNIQYQSALKRIYEIQKRAERLSSYFYIFGKFVVGVFLIILILVFSNIFNNMVDSSSRLKIIQEKENSLLESLNNLQNYEKNNLVNEISHLPLNMKLNVRGINTNFDGKDLIVTFKNGLFDIGTNLKPEAIKILSELGTYLEPYSGRIYIHIYGCTDNIPMPSKQKYSDNTALGQARAIKVFEIFRKTTRLPPDRILIGTFGEYLPPFSNDTPESRAKNRTVIIKISH